MSSSHNAEVQTKAASVRVLTGAVNARLNKHKIGNPRKFGKRFLALCQAAKNCNDKDRLREDISNFVNSDLSAFKLQHQSAALEKLSAQQNIEALRKKQDELQGQIEVVQGEIQQKKEELEESKIRKQHQEEYEQLKKLVMNYPKRSETEAAIQKIRSEIAELQRESRKVDQTIELRRKQFCQLGLVLRDLSADVECPPEDDADAPDASHAMEVE